MGNKMLYGTMHDSAILTIGKKLGRKGKKSQADDVEVAVLLVWALWQMVSWGRRAPLAVVPVLVVGFVWSGLAGAVAAYFAVGFMVGGLRFAARIS